MPVLETKVDRKSAEFAGNTAALKALVEELRARQARCALGGGEAARAKHVGRGKLLPRDRVEALLDPGSPFLELSPMAASLAANSALFLSTFESSGGMIVGQ